MAVKKTSEVEAKQGPKDSGTVYGTDLRALGINAWMISLFVPNELRRKIGGRVVEGIERNPNKPGTQRFVYKKDPSNVREDGSVGHVFLEKEFNVLVPCEEGIYDLNSHIMEEGATRETYENIHVRVTGNGAEATIEKVGFGDVIEHFGGTRITRGTSSRMAAKALN